MKSECNLGTLGSKNFYILSVSIFETSIQGFILIRKEVLCNYESKQRNELGRRELLGKRLKITDQPIKQTDLKTN